MTPAERAPRPTSLLRASIPDQPADIPPPEVAAALWPLPAGGNWDGGTVDRHGRHWTHQPWQGWQPSHPSPYLTRGRVYESKAARRARRGRHRRRMIRRTATPALAVAGVLMCAGLTITTALLALAGLTVAALAVFALAWAAP